MTTLSPETISPDNLTSLIRAEVRAAVSEALKEVMASIERDEYLSISRLAERLGLCRQTVSKRLKKAGLEPDERGRYSLKTAKEIIDHHVVVSSQTYRDKRYLTVPSGSINLDGTFL